MNPIKMKLLQMLMDDMGEMEISKLKPKKSEDMEPSMDPIELLKEKLSGGEPVGVMKKAIIIKKSSPEEEDSEEDMSEDEMEDEESSNAPPRIAYLKKKLGK